MLYTNALIFTSDPERPEADAMVVKEDRIRWIGSLADLPSAYSKEPVTDLNGRRVIPGIVDAHMHPVMLAECMDKITCLPPLVNSIEDLKKAIREKAEVLPADAWIRGWGFDEGKLAEHRTPTKEDLDEASLGHPVELLRSCSHIRSVNSRVLSMANITKESPEVPGGEIVRNADGEPNGVLLENARHLVADLLPEQGKEDLIDQLGRLGQLLLSYGITALTDMGNFLPVDYYDIYQKAAEKGLIQEMGLYYMWDLMREVPGFDLTPEVLDPKARIHAMGLKLIADGAVAGRTAWMGRPYRDGEDCGMPVCSDAEFESAIAFCKSHKCQLSVHAMGMRAIDRSLSFLAKEDGWMPEGIPTFRLEHCTDPSEEAISLAIEKKIPFVIQPIFFYSEIESYEKNLGMDWTKKTYPIRKLLDRGVTVALSTDSPATSWATMYDPFVNLQASVTRTAYDGTDCGKEQAIDIRTALTLYTRESAKAAGFSAMGMLKEGYKANFLVLDRDVLTIDSDSIADTRVLQTYIEGACVYRR